jgi:peptide/nickel transport system substrate-binding protein
MTQFALDNVSNELGMNIQHSPMQFSAYVEEFLGEPNDWQVACHRRNGSPERIDPHQFIYTTYHSDFAGDGGLNHSHFDKIDDLAEEQMRTTDQDERQDVVYECQDVFSEWTPEIHLGYQSARAAVNTNRFSNWTPWPAGNVFGNRESLAEVQSEGPDTLIKATTTGVPNLNWAKYIATAIGREIKMIYDSLLHLGFDGTVKAGLAEEWEWIDDQTMEFTLREGLTFHDGEPLTAEDVKFTYEFANEWESTDYHRRTTQIDNVEVIDERTGRFNLNTVFAPFAAVSMARVEVIPKHIWDGVVEENDLENPGQWSDPDLTGSGPMQVVNYEPPGQINYEVFDDHYMDFDFSELIMNRFGGISAASAAVEEGSADFVHNLNATEYNRLQNSGSVETVNQPTVGYTALACQINKKPIGDVALRRAMAHVIDTEQLVNTVTDGLSVPGESTMIAPMNEFWHNPDRAYEYREGVERARQVLEDAGYTWENGNLMYPDPIPEERLG